MFRAIREFAGLLRQAGLPVSPAEIGDCLRAVEAVGLAEPDFKQALRATLVKSAAQEEIFERLYRLFFYGGSARDGKQGSGILPPPENRASSADGRGLGRSGAGGPAPDLVRLLQEGGRNELRQAARLALAQLAQAPRDAGDVREKLRRAKVKLDWHMTLHRLEKMLEEGEISLEAYTAWRGALDELEGFLAGELQKMLLQEYGRAALVEIARAENYREKDFNLLDRRETRLIEREVSRLGRRLAVKKSRRLKPAAAGRVDLRRVVRRAAARGGFAAELAYRRRTITRPELVVLCDVSNSVAPFSTFMLRLVYAAQNLFRDVHTFVFVDRLRYVSPLLKDRDAEEAVGEIKFLAGVSESGCSHFGRVFREFCSAHLELLGEETTLLILGDGKNNWRPPGGDYLAQMAARCRKLYWLNPQPRENWERDDCVMGVYAPHCTGVYECRNLRQLEEVTGQIF